MYAHGNNTSCDCVLFLKTPRNIQSTKASQIENQKAIACQTISDLAQQHKTRITGKFRRMILVLTHKIGAKTKHLLSAGCCQQTDGSH